MRVLHIGKYFPPHHGGMETFLRDVMAEQQRTGHSVHALVHQSKRGFVSSDEEYMWRGQTLKVTRVSRWGTAAFTPISPLFMWHIWRLLRRVQPDLIHLHVPNPAAFWCLLLPSARRLKWVIQWQSDVLPSEHKLMLKLLYGIYKLPERWMLAKANAIIASSPPYLASSSALSAFKEKCHVVPLAIEDLAVAACSSTKPDDISEDLRVLAVGRLTYYKGHDVILRAMKIAPQVTLTLVGNGEEYQRLRRLTHQLELDARVRFVTDCSETELAAFYAQSDLLCLPSIERTESFGIVLLEAMRQRVPCVVANIAGSGAPWVTGYGTSGFLFPVSDHVALGRLLDELRANRDKLGDMAQAGRKRFDDAFRLVDCCDAISQIYESSFHARSTQDRSTQDRST